MKNFVKNSKPNLVILHSQNPFVKKLFNNFEGCLGIVLLVV